VKALVAVLVGGMAGTGLRLLADTLIPHSDTGFPVSTLLVNVVGSFVLGLVVARLWSRLAPWLRAGLGTGLLGSFTTFSALMVSVVALGSHGLWALAVAYFVLTLVLGFAAAAIGLRVGRVATLIDWVDE
jgi:CrcB protein